MIAQAFPRRLAASLLHAAISIAPHEALDWGHAMLGELRHVEGNWPALFWSLGGAGVLAKHALVALIFPSRNRPTIPSGGDLFAKESSMRKPALAVIASCVLASLLFFLAPVFRQAFQVSLAQWHDVLHVRSPLDGPWRDERRDDSALEAIRRKAEQDHDAEALAFVAVRTMNQSESAGLADEAIHLDPNLTWIYAIVAVKWSSLPRFDRWIPALEKFDPQNALPYLITAEKIDIDQVVGHQIPHHIEDESQAWKNAMAAAFESPKLDTYPSQYNDLQRRVLAKYKIDDPFQALDDSPWWYGLPSYSVGDAARYGESLLESGAKLEAQGNNGDAFEKYSQVAKFSQLMGEKRSFLRNDSLHDAFIYLEKLSRKEGNAAQAGLYASLADGAESQRQQVLNGLRARFRGYSVARWDALVARASGAAMLFSGFLLLACLVAVCVRRRSIRLATLSPSRLTLALSSAASVLALLSSAMLYVSYRPYAEIFQRFVSNGDESAMAELSIFLSNTQVPLGTGMNRFLDFQSAVFYFWLGVALVCACVLVVAVLRHLQTRRRTATA